jgi:hypothetical protein
MTVSFAPHVINPAPLLLYDDELVAGFPKMEATLLLIGLGAVTLRA